MQENYANIIAAKADEKSLSKLNALNSDELCGFIAESIELCKPASVIVFDDSAEDVAAVRQLSLDNGEETTLAMEGHTIHYDGYSDQARAKDVTKYLLPKGVDLGERLNSMDREEGLAEIKGFFDGAMAGKAMLVRLFCLGPAKSEFTICCAQITDSAYVAHSEDILYRGGYEAFKERNSQGNGEFFRFLHTAGRLDGNVSADTDKKRVYMDLSTDTVMSTNTQYAGNTVGLKKLALRLAIRKADREGWLAEHMFIMGSQDEDGGVTYFAGAFPSACGKTSTAMIPGETIVGDDLAYFRNIDGVMRAVNVESGIFGIIRDVNGDDDPVIHSILNNPGEVIFSNILINDGKCHWLGMTDNDDDLPAEGVNHSGQWTRGKTGPDGKEVTAAHKNARYTVRISSLSNRDELADDPKGVETSGIIYGGRDSDTCVPVAESFDWAHGIITMGASLESETTAATLGAEGVRTFNLMSNMDFLSMPLGKYIQNNLQFTENLTKCPPIFGVNYFLKENGKYLNGMRDKAVWVKWMSLRVRSKADAIESPIGLLPVYEDLQKLFKQYLDKDYTKDDYNQQFTIRIPNLLAKIERIEKIYRSESQVPEILFEILAAQKDRLVKFQAEKGDFVLPENL